MFTGWMTLNNQTTPWLSTKQKKITWMTIKETIRQVKLWSQNRLLIGLTSQPEELMYLTFLWNNFICSKYSRKCSLNVFGNKVLRRIFRP